MPVGELLELRFAGHIIEEVAATYERVCGRVCLKEIRPSELIFSGELGPRPQNLVYQSVSNMVLAVIGLVHSHVWGHMTEIASGRDVKLVGIAETIPDLVAEAKKAAGPNVPSN